MHKAMKLISFLSLVLAAGCASTTEPEFGEVDWFLSNGAGSGMTLVVYDKNCNRTFFRIELPRNGRVGMTTCHDSEGKSEIRYRRKGKIAVGNVWRDATMTAGQHLVVQ